MSTPRTAAGESTPDDARTPFQRFQDLTRRILTTPKAELMKGNGKSHARRTPKKK